MNLKEIAIRVALYDELADKLDPNYTRVLGILNTKIRNRFKDLVNSVKDEDETLTLHNLRLLMEDLEEIYKFMGMRKFRQQMDNMVNKTFE